MAIFHLNREANLTVGMALESLKLVEQSLKDKDEEEKLDNAQRAMGSDRDEKKCFHCQRTGHVKTYCYDWLDNTSEGRAYAQENSHPRRPPPYSKNPRRGEKSNYSCPTSSTKKPSSSSTYRGRNAKAKAAAEDGETTGNESSSSEDRGWIAEDSTNFSDHDFLEPEETASMAIKGQDRETPDDWMLDSGCSRHMTPNRNLFTEIIPYRKPVRIANGQQVYTKGRGNIEIMIDNKAIQMTDVLHVLDFDSNLLSISALNRKGLGVLFQGSEVEILQKSKCVATGTLRERTYYLESSQIALMCVDNVNIPDLLSTNDLDQVNMDSLNLTAASSQQELPQHSQTWLWHARFGHASPQRLVSLNLDNFTLQVKDFLCTTCDFNKLTRNSSRDSPDRESICLRLVHTDIWGPYHVRSLGGNRYFISFIDDCSRKSWIECLRSRDQIFQVIKQWQAIVELESDAKVVRFRCDNAKEYIKSERLIKTEGIQMEYTSTYTPEQNGVAERYNRTVVQIVRAMFTWAGLPVTFWAEAAKTANYLRNRLPSGEDKMCPEELWSAKKPSVDHLKTFGCLVHVHIPKEKQAKLDKVSYQGIFVGYHSTTQFRVYNPQTRQVDWPTAVKFLEHVPGGRLLRQDESKDTTTTVDISTGLEEDEDETEILTFGDAPKQGGKLATMDVPGQVGVHEENSTDIHTPIPPATSSTQRTDQLEIPQPMPRRSTRITKPYDRYTFDKSHASMEKSLDKNGRNKAFQAPNILEPKSYAEARKCSDWRKWAIAMDEKLCALIANGTWEYCKRPRDQNIVTSKWIFKVKYTYNNLVNRYKARLVARGFTQVFGIDYDKTFAPTL